LIPSIHGTRYALVPIMYRKNSPIVDNSGYSTHFDFGEF